MLEEQMSMARQMQCFQKVPGAWTSYWAKGGHLQVEACVADGADALCDGIASDSRKANGL